MRTHYLIKASEDDTNAATERVREAKGNFFPTMNFAGNIGNEQFNKPPETENTNAVTREVSLTVTQLLWDFGASYSTHRAAKLNKILAEANLSAARQDLLLRAIIAFLSVERDAVVLEFARESEQNIFKQTEAESELLELGFGLSTDVLQAKSQLAGAKARRVQASTALANSIETFRTVFGFPPEDPTKLVSHSLPIEGIPKTVEDTVKIGVDENPKLLAAVTGTLVSQEVAKTTRSSSFFPRLDIIAESRFKKDVAGTLGYQRETLGKVQINFPFNLGFTAINTLKAAEFDASALNNRTKELKALVEEGIRIAWNNWKSAQETSEFLEDQAMLAEDFLALAREERQLGNRTLLDVLAGETALINAFSDAVSAKTDIAIQLYTLLNGMGHLTLESINIPQNG